MNKKEKTIRNIGLSFDFLREIIRDPKLINSIQDGTNIDFIEKDFTKIEKIKPGKTKYFKVKSVFEKVSN
ncbi:MAG TPA: hypothetical protein PK605_14600 [Ignavibacteria bacterium]|nr:hypothetical protein [Bacteroidota bacterium]HRE09798.1 hypothetical protein [Ignavibacteria bacterium]HRF65476.1 hypothetical protein [Ignavibacteria bacterium]HRJ05629.1 hypothetical protein [Ignavibacteria bacterium]HRJ86891.1 hypothetical protein [Ignavibacteria bacterium]